MISVFVCLVLYYIAFFSILQSNENFSVSDSAVLHMLGIVKINPTPSRKIYMYTHAVDGNALTRPPSPYRSLE